MNCEVHRRGIELIRPGARCMDIARELNEIYAGHGMLDRRTFGYGHSFGTLCHYYGREAGLEFREDVETVLVPGMVVSMEPMITVPEDCPGRADTASTTCSSSRGRGREPDRLSVRAGAQRGRSLKYILSPEGQARLATSSCYWAMPANAKAAAHLTEQQRRALRWDDQPGYLARSQLYPAPSAELDAKMQDVWTEFMQHRRSPRANGGAPLASKASIAAHERRTAWRLVLPALLWTLAFFVVPFACMVAMSLWRRTGTELVCTWDLQNYAAFFAKPYFVEGLVNSLEITKERA